MYSFFSAHMHWVQSKRHWLWFSKKTCSCYSTKTHIHSVILILKLNLTSLKKTYTLKCGCCSTMTTFNVYVSKLSQIQFEDEDHAVYKSVLQITVLLVLYKI